MEVTSLDFVIESYRFLRFVLDLEALLAEFP